MIIVKLKGGLGNQMFQYATARQLSDFHGVELKLDLSFLMSKSETDTHTLRNFELDKLNINAEIATEKEIYQLKKGRWANFFLHNYTKEQNANFNKKILKSGKNCFLEGYFQCEKYFFNVKDIICKEFTFKQPLNENYFIELTEKIKNCNSVSIHFRRGDYVESEHINKFHGVCSLEYYKKASENISKKIDNPHFFIFSDDIQWVKANFKLNFPTFFVEKSDENLHSDFRLMSLCRHNIIANSSYSWWAAWLNQNPDKQVIAPEKWFANEQQQAQTKDLIPQKWTKL